jgi:adenosine deaminase CECR1
MGIRNVFGICVLLLILVGSVYSSDIPLEREPYLDERATLIDQDRSYRRSASLELSAQERAADHVLQRLKAPWDSLATWQYPPASRFHHVRAAYDASPLLAVMDRLPKGALLHAHPSATGSFGLLLDATYDEHVYIYQGPDSLWQPTGSLRWADEAPGPLWDRAIVLRAHAKDADAFDRELLESITLGLEDYDNGDIWDHFENNFSRMWNLAAEPRLWKQHMLNTCRELAEQNVQLVEFHTYIGPNRRADGSLGTASENIETWLAIRDSIRIDYPNFDLKLVGAITRWNSEERVRGYLRTVVEMKQAYPDVVVGYDLVSEEDKASTNLHFLGPLLEAHRYADSLDVELRPCIHSGESNRLDNENLFDAVLLHAKRIGHGYGLWRHPELMNRALEQDIAIEICPISNQALGFIVDLRNHPAVEYLARGIPVVLSPDDPGMMSYRWAYDWVAVTSAWDLGIADIKQMILDSYEYSGYNEATRRIAIDNWEKDWQEWVSWLSEQ